MKLTIVGILPLVYASVLFGCNSQPQNPDVKVDEQKAQPSPESSKSYVGSLAGLDAYRGKELAKFNEAENVELTATIKKLIPNREYESWFDFHPWHVWEFPNNGQPVLLLFDVYNSGPHPGTTGIRITVFEKKEKVWSEFGFGTGHRCYMQAVSLEKQGADRDPLIVIETGFGPGPGPGYQRQIYARIGNRFDLIRLEGGDGKATRNNYYVNHFACGPTIPKHTPAQWEADVFSDDRTRVLRALTWLGGSHWEGQPPDKSEKQHEPAEQIELIRNVRANQKVADKLKALANSQDQWVREAAVLAADPKDYRW